MKKEIHQVIESGLLDQYILGNTSKSESRKIELLLESSHDLRQEYDIRQEELELSARHRSVAAPESVLERVMERIDTDTSLRLLRNRSYRWFAAAASAAAVLFATTSLIYYNYNQTLIDENDTIAAEIFDLRDDIATNNEKLDAVMRELSRLNNPETQKYVLKGNDRAKDLKTVAYINPVEKSSLIDVVSLPQLSDEQVYRMWAEVNDKKIDLGVLDKADRKLRAIPYVENALSLSITIEPRNGLAQNVMDQEVAEVTLDTQNN